MEIQNLRAVKRRNWREKHLPAPTHLLKYKQKEENGVNKEKEGATDKIKVHRKVRRIFWLLVVLFCLLVSSLFINWGIVFNTNDPPVLTKIALCSLWVAFLGLVLKEFHTAFDSWPWQ